MAGEAAARYMARVDAVLAQRTRLRGKEPPGDLFAGLPPDHPLLTADPRRPFDPNLAAIAEYVEADDSIVDIGGGAGRISLALALRCRHVVNVEPSAAMGTGFRANAARAGIDNTSIIESSWLAAEPPQGTLALANHVAYHTRDIVQFVDKLEQAGTRRVVMTVNDPPPPSWHRLLFQALHGEPEAVEPGHVELANVLWEMGILPDIRVLPNAVQPVVATPTREAAIARALANYRPQWSFWPLGADLEARLCGMLEGRFEELFAAGTDGFSPRWITPGREILVTWRPAIDRRVL
jgi:SAM-dependent methyltransferase